MAGFPQIPGQHPHMAMPGFQPPAVPQHILGNPMQGLPVQLPFPFYLGFLLTPDYQADGKQSWNTITPQQIHKSQAEFAEIIKKEKSNKIKVNEVYQSSSLSGEKRGQVDRILQDHQQTERDPNLEWKLASIKLTEVKVDSVNSFAKVFVRNTQVNKIRVILKRVLRTQPKATRRQSVPLPINMNMHQQPQMHGFLPQEFQQRPQQHPNQGHLYNEMPPPPPNHHGVHPGRPAMVPLGRSPVAEVISDYEEDLDRHRSRKDHKRDRSSSPKIRIPEFRERRDSKASSRLTSFSNDSEIFALESPNTSRSNSPRHWPDSRRHSKKYHSRKGSELSRRERRGSTGSNDSFVIINGNSPRKHGSTGSHGSRSIEKWSQAIAPSSRRRDSYYHDDTDHRALERKMQKLRVAELERQEEDRLELEHNIEMNDRIARLERKNVVHQDLDRYGGRPILNRARSDRSSIGFMPRPRFGGMW